MSAVSRYQPYQTGTRGFLTALSNYATRQLPRVAGKVAKKVMNKAMDRKRAPPASTPQRLGKHVRIHDPSVYKPKSRKLEYKKSKKSPAVPKKLKAQINKVIAPNKPSGFYHETAYYSKYQTFNNQQYMTALSDRLSGTLFSPIQILNAASILFNGKAATFANPAIADAGNFGANNLRVKVLWSNAIYLLRNNSQRTLYVQLYEMKLKTIEAATEPVAALNLSLIDENADGINITNSTSAEMFLDPTKIREFTQRYASEKTEVVLQPGENYTWKITGPSNYIYDFEKFKLATVFQNFQKVNRFAVINIKYDVIGTTLAVTGRLAEGTANPGNGLLVEERLAYKIEMPEETLVPARHAAYAFKNYAITPTGTNVRVDEENPAAVEAPPN